MFKVTEGSMQATRAVPDLQKRLIELHKGHGPLAFKWLQRVTAIGLIFAMLAGLWLAFSSSKVRKAAASSPRSFAPCSSQMRGVPAPP